MSAQSTSGTPPGAVAAVARGAVHDANPWLIVALAVGGAIAAIDWLWDGQLVLIGLYSVASLLASLRVGPGGTAIVAVYTVVLGLLGGEQNGIFGTSDHVARVLVVAQAGAFAIALSLLRQRGERATRAARKEQRRSMFLSEAAVLLEASLDYEQRLQNIAALAVPRMADWAFVEMVQDDGSIKRVAMAHAERSKEALVREYARRYPIDPEAPAGSAKVIRTGRPELMCEIPDAMLEAVAQDPEHLRILRELGFRSAMVVPLRVGSRTIGDIALVSAESGRRYDEDDLAMAQQLATSCGLAIENARLYSEARASEERSRLLVEAVSDYAIFMLDPHGLVTSWNAGAERIKGYRQEEIIGKPHSSFYPKEDIERGKPERVLADAAREGRYEEEGLRVRKDGSSFVAHVVITALYSNGELRGFSKVTRDITERKQLEERLNHQALHDPLTGLANRVLVLDRLSHPLARSERRSGQPALILLDLDRFKWVNDSLGHAAGDELLDGVARRLEQAVRLEDTVGRFGGDEFTVLCEEVKDEAHAVAVAERLAEALRAPVRVADRELVVEASIGIALAGGAGHTAESVLREADTAMYRAKERGKGRYQVFEEGMRPTGAERLAIEGDLRQAVQEDGFYVVYQPILDVPTGNFIGAEALVRWKHPSQGELRPDAFIPLTEETGQIHSIGAFVLRTACRQVREWNDNAPDQPSLAIFVNVSATQLDRPEFPEQVAKTVDEFDISPSSLCLEITESALMSEARTTLHSLLALRGIGVRLAIDDFGTGYSSLTQLRRFTVDCLKVDSSFVNGLGRHTEDRALCTGITDLAHALDLAVVAEGVENQLQLEELGALGCELAQGYHIARPQPPAALHEMLCVDRRWKPATARPHAAVSDRQALLDGAEGLS